MQYLAVLAFLLALFLFWLARNRRTASGLPSGRVIYTDTRFWGHVEEPLFDQSLGLTGKPDYLVQRAGQIIPVEVKSTRAEAPYDSHIYQLAAYCLLVERVSGTRPPYGILHYARGGSERTFAIDYTPALESALLDLLAEIRSLDRKKEVARSHNSPARCRSCGYRQVCDQALLYSGKEGQE